MNITTQKWSPADCKCSINTKHFEGPGAAAIDESDQNIMMYCSLAEATNIRRTKHQVRMAALEAMGDQAKIRGEQRWWKRKQAQPYTENKCPDHAGLSGDAWYIVLRDESARRQLSINIIQNLNPALRESDDFQPQHSWSGTDADRVLTLYLTTQEILDIGPDLQPMLDVQFGPGKVLIENAVALQEDLLSELLAL